MPSYTPNAWPYVHCPNLTIENIAARLMACGFDGFDLFVGPESRPFLPLDAPSDRQAAIRAAAPISSVMFIGFDLADPTSCAAQLQAAPRLARAVGTSAVHLLPRKNGITHAEGFRRLEKVWRENAAAVAGLLVRMENHSVNPNPDEDVFLVRVAADCDRVLALSGGVIKLKYDPAWFLWAGEDPLPAFDRLRMSGTAWDVGDGPRSGTAWDVGDGPRSGVGAERDRRGNLAAAGCCWGVSAVVLWWPVREVVGQGLNHGASQSLSAGRTDLASDAWI